MPSFCATPSELVRQHPKRNIPPQQTSIQHMLLLSLLHVPPRMPAEMGSVYQDSLCVVCVCVCVRMHVLVCGTSAESSEAQSGRNTRNLTLTVCTCACMCVCLFVCVCVCLFVCVWVFVYVWEGRLCWSVPECWKWQGDTVGKRSSPLGLYVQKQTTAVEPCHWLEDTYSNMFGCPKTHCQRREPDSISPIKWKEQLRHFK